MTLFKSSAHLLLWVLGAVVFLVVGVLAIDLGLIDAVFGTSTQEALHLGIEHLRKVYQLKGSHIEIAVKVIGLAVSAVFGLLAFLKGLDYAEINLPARMVELNERIKKLVLHDRIVILAPYATRNLKGDTAHTATETFGPLLHRIRTPPREKSIRRLMGSVGRLEIDIPVLASNLAKCRAQRITAHLLEGLKLVAKANAMERNTAVQVSTDEAALAEFRKALKLDEKDLDALEYGAKQAKRLNLFPEMQRYLDTMEVAAQEQGRSMRTARAMRFQAEVLEERSGTAPKRNARTKLEKAITVLNDPDSQNMAAEKLLEAALVNEQLGALHLVRGTPTLVKPNLDDAFELYGKLSGPEGAAGRLRIEQLRVRLALDVQGGDDPDDTEEANQVDPNFPTHVSPELLRVLEAPNGRRADCEPIPPFTGLTVLTVLTTSENWALIARKGAPLGYVPETKLRPLQ